MSSLGSRRDDTSTHRYRYDGRLANEIEKRWQDRWEELGTFNTPNPVGDLAEGFDTASALPKLYVLDMFPYPSGVGLHVGHPLGFIGTDVYARHKRMTGYNVVHAMGYDAFGLPAEEHARQTGEHPRTNTEANVKNYRRQLRALGLGHDTRRSIATTDPEFYRWTQWIFLEIFNSWYDIDADRARPIEELIAEFESGERSPSTEAVWAEMSASERQSVIADHRLAYIDEAPVNWCPELGTVLANEEVTADGRSDRGNFPVFRRPLRQWKMRITAYADRLLADLETVDWPHSVKLMQRNWIGRSEGAQIRFATSSGQGIDVFTTRPDTIFGATYMVLAPEHPLVDELTAPTWPGDTPTAWKGSSENPRAAVAAYRETSSKRSDLERQAVGREKSGVFIGATVINPATNTEIPVFVADYVLMGYGTGAIMAVPGQDQRDWDFATAFDLPVIRTVQPPDDFDGDAYLGDGPATNSANEAGGLVLDGLIVADAKATTIEWLEKNNCGKRTVTYKLRDWLFSRQRYWGEPFPIVYDEDGAPLAVPENLLPIELPELIDWAPRSLSEESEPEPPLGRATEWATVKLDLGDGLKSYRRELNTMPQWAGSCWYYLRYLDPGNANHLVDPDIERYWMTADDGGVGGVDLYVGGVEHAVLHLLYARFWHKVLFDLGHVSGPEPFQRLFNQGYILAAAYTTGRGTYVEAAEVVESPPDEFTHSGNPVTRTFGKMGKSLKNAVTPDEMYDEYGADTLRLYEMFMGPMDQDRPWETKSVIGSQRLLQRIWRNLIDEVTGEVRLSDDPMPIDIQKALHRTIRGVDKDMAAMRFNTAIAKITEFNNSLTASSPPDRSTAETLILLISPLTPHFAEELWSRLGHDSSLAYEPFPVADPELLLVDSIEIPIQINGKVRARIQVDAGCKPDDIETMALAEPRIVDLLDGTPPRRIIVVPDKMVSIVT